MAWTPVLLVLLSHCTGSLSQPVLTQPPSLSASPGTTARLTCTLSSGFIVGSYSMLWYQQKSRISPVLLLRTYRYQGSGVPSSGSDLVWYLTIQNIQEDDTDSNCGANHGSGSSFVYPQCDRYG
uniref:Ig-like domain-containing protein n=1 Tax=Panthera tigris altaica TaxID=74533 RepID=A0A8C9K7A1_PANTA